MARSRTLHPQFFTNDALYHAERDSGLPLRVAFEGLWCHADRLGRFEWHAPRLKLGILPYDVVDFDTVLDALEDAQFIIRYAVDGKEYGAIPTFLRHQKPHPREAPSKIPAPPEQSQGMTKATPRRGRGKSKSAGLSSLRTLKPSDSQASALPSASGATNWPADLAAVLSLVGPVTPGRLGKQLAPLLRDNPHLATHGVPLLLEAGRAYARSVERMDQQQAARLKHPHDFISRAGFWVDQVRPGGLVELVGET